MVLRGRGILTNDAKRFGLGGMGIYACPCDSGQKIPRAWVHAHATLSYYGRESGSAVVFELGERKSASLLLVRSGYRSKPRGTASTGGTPMPPTFKKK